MAEVQQMGLELSIDEQTGQGRYSNLVVITHSASEFVLDFASMLPAMWSCSKTTHNSRISG